MMAPMYEIVLVAVMVVQNTSGAPQLEYRAIDYYSSWAKCYQEEKKWSRTKDSRTGYICVKVDRE